MTWPFDKLRRCRRLGDLLARPAGELLANGLDHLPLPRHHLQGLGDGLAELGELAAAARAGTRPGNDHALARQMRRKGSPYRFLAGEADHRRGIGWLSGGFGFGLGRARLQFLELQFQLVDQLAATFGGLPVLLALQLGDQQLVMGDHRLGAGRAHLGLLPCRALGGKRRLQRGDILGKRLGRRHGPDCLTASMP